MPWALRSPNRPSVVQGLGRALELAAGWGWAGVAQVVEDWAGAAQAGEGRACRCHLRGIIRAAAALPVTPRLSGILQRSTMIGIAALAPDSPHRMPVCCDSPGHGRMHRSASDCTSQAVNCATGTVCMVSVEDNWLRDHLGGGGEGGGGLGAGGGSWWWWCLWCL